MTVQVSFPHKDLTAIMACKRVVADRVRLRVICQLYLVCEYLVTLTAVKEAFNAMLQRLVFFQLRFLRVALVADIASERLLTCVVPCVRDQCALALEPFPARRAVDHHARFTLTHQTPFTLALFLRPRDQPVRYRMSHVTIYR
jgi:hypothetical protein